MTDFLSVAKASDIPPGEMKTARVGDANVVIANVDGTFFAFGGLCSHEEAPLEEGELDADVVTCPWHFTRFNVRTGEGHRWRDRRSDPGLRDTGRGR